jgi:6-pyruvoyltetrahydropterin/6-carboxytetrahydropterin synthase
MPYRICKSFEIENGHMLSRHPDNCRFPHGHSRRVEIVLSADSLDDHQMVCDFKLLKLAIGEYLDSLDHALCMNTEDPAYAEMKARYGDRVIGYPGEDPTTEIMARDIFRRCVQALTDYRQRPGVDYGLRPEVRLDSVRLWETSSSWAEYSE